MMQHQGNILVTGASGVIGKAMKRLNKEYFYVTSADADLTDYYSTERLISTLKPRTIIHLAALSGGMQLSREKSADLFTVNTLMAINLFKASQKYGISRLGFALSGAAYGGTSGRFAREAELHNAPILEEDFSYGYAKRGIEILIQGMNKQYGLQSYSFVINGAIGRDMNFDPERSIAVASLIRRIYKSRENKDEITVWGDGSPRRQYTWAEDLARNISWCHDNQAPGTVLNIGTNEVVTIKSLAEMICAELRVDPKRLFFDVTKGTGKTAQLTDNSVFTSLSAMNFMPIQAAIKKICAEVEENTFA
jgi:GDP-L-fucose synthase